MTMSPVWLPPGDPYLATYLCSVDLAEPRANEILDFIEIRTEPEACTSDGNASSVEQDLNDVSVPDVLLMQRAISSPCKEFIENPYYVVLKQFTPASLFGHRGPCNMACTPVSCCEYFRMKKDSLLYRDSVRVQFRVRTYDGKTVTVDEYPYLFVLAINNIPIDVGKFPGLNNQDKLPVVKGKLLDVTHCFYQSDGTPVEINYVRVMWSPADKRKFICSIRFVVERTLEALLAELQARPMFTSKDLLEKLFNSGDGDEDDDVMLCNVETSLLCPITFTRINIPCRSVKCKHVDCFDAKTFLLSNKCQIEWLCPLCKSRISFNDLRIDSLLTDILSSTQADVLKADVSYDGTWTPVDDRAKFCLQKRIKSENAYFADEDSDERLDIISVGSDEHLVSVCTSPTTSATAESAPDHNVGQFNGTTRTQLDRSASPEIIDLTMDDNCSSCENSVQSEFSECTYQCQCEHRSAAPQVERAHEQYARDVRNVQPCGMCYPIVVFSDSGQCPQSRVVPSPEAIASIYYSPTAPISMPQPYQLAADIPSTSRVTQPYLPTSSSVRRVLNVDCSQIHPNVQCPFLYGQNMYLPHFPR
uniref:SP-RING-type domain-containing protein n=1 Tax=Trichuris muris TaxID=70415 RepID=A0A5S6QN77_TRIMR